MEILIATRADIRIAALRGDVNATTAAEIQRRMLPFATTGEKIVLDFSQVSYMSSAGLRMLLSLYRQAAAKQGRLVLVGLSDNIRDTMSMTGLLNYFTTCENLDAGLAILGWSA